MADCPICKKMLETENAPDLVMIKRTKDGAAFFAHEKCWEDYCIAQELDESLNGCKEDGV